MNLEQYRLWRDKKIEEYLNEGKLSVLEIAGKFGISADIVRKIDNKTKGRKTIQIKKMKNFYQIKKDLDKILEQAKKEALNDGVNILSPKFEKLLEEAKSRLLTERDVDIKEFEEWENSYSPSDFSHGAVGKVVDQQQKLSSELFELRKKLGAFRQELQEEQATLLKDDIENGLKELFQNRKKVISDIEEEVASIRKGIENDNLDSLTEHTLRKGEVPFPIGYCEGALRRIDKELKEIIPEAKKFGINVEPYEPFEPYSLPQLPRPKPEAKKESETSKSGWLEKQLKKLKQ